MIELIGAGGRVPPIHLSHLQVMLAAAAGLGVLLAAIGLIAVEGLLARVLGFLLQLTGHPPPKKSPMRVALDEMEKKMNRERPQPPIGKGP